jgi:hypothetical protein
MIQNGIASALQHLLPDFWLDRSVLHRIMCKIPDLLKFF